MKVGDLVRVNESHWNDPGEIGIIVHDLGGKGRAFKVLLGSGKIRPKINKQLEKLNEN
jgi:hypothetical protein